jgi:DNA-binding CsgD family transcriptional regulator/PAS domain-containing protein
MRLNKGNWNKLNTQKMSPPLNPKRLRQKVANMPDPEYQSYIDQAILKISELEKTNTDLKESSRRLKKELTEALKENEFYNEIVNEVDAIIYINKFLEDGAYKTMWINKELEKMTGYDLTEVQEFRSTRQNEVFYAEGHFDIVRDTWQFFHDNPGGMYSAVYKRQDKSGDWKWFYVTGHVFKTKPDGTPDECLCVGLDFSKRIDTDKYLRELLNENLRLKYELEISRLTKKEKLVLELIAQGKTNKKIAEELSISCHTVDSHRKNLLHKLGFKNTAELVKFATSCGVI